MDALKIVVAWVLIGFIGILGVILLWKMWKGDIDLNKLISEPNGDASLSRFQFLIFTFVISMSIFFVILSTSKCELPNIPASILSLLGISGGSYVVSKGIQTNRDTTLENLKLKGGDPPSDATAKLKSALDAISGSH